MFQVLEKTVNFQSGMFIFEETDIADILEVFNPDYDDGNILPIYLNFNNSVFLINASRFHFEIKKKWITFFHETSTVASTETTEATWFLDGLLWKTPKTEKFQLVSFSLSLPKKAFLKSSMNKIIGIGSIAGYRE